MFCDNRDCLNSETAETPRVNEIAARLVLEALLNLSVNQDNSQGGEARSHWSSKALIRRAVPFKQKRE